MVKRIHPRNNNKVLCLVDEEDYLIYKDFPIFYTKHPSGKEYIKIHINKETVGIHRIILNVPKGLEVDHIDGNGLNNQKSNLRICTRKQNCKSRKINRNNTTGYKGVVWRKERSSFRAEIRSDYKKIRGPKRNTAKEASLDYNELAKKYHGEFAVLN